MKILLHVGMGKTGTTAIQRVLARNRARLQEQGVIYPNFFDENAHSGLCLTCMRPGDWRYPRGYRALSDAERAERVGHVDAAMEHAVSSGAELLLLSSEYIFYLDADAQLALRERLSRSGGPIRIAAWLRHPVDYYFSASRQRVKIIGGVGGTPPRPPEAFSVNLEKSVARLKEVWDDVLLLPYDATQMKGGDIVPDFFYRLLRDHVSFTPPSVRANVGHDADVRLWREDRDDIVRRLRQNCASDIAFYETMFPAASA